MTVLFTYLWVAFLGSCTSLGFFRRPFFLKFVWFMRNCAAVSALMVTLLFWTLLFPMIGHTNFVDVHCHAVGPTVLNTGGVQSHGHDRMG